MRVLHTMIRVGDLDRSIGFYTTVLGMRLLRTTERPEQGYTLAFLGYGDEASSAVIELTYNHGVDRYDLGTAYGHIAIGVPMPAVAISNARTQWGVCTEGGRLRLSWRLVHFEPALADYVVAHEAAHLVEMNHSKRFWKVVEALYPDWRAARKAIEVAGASLPIL